LGTQSCQDEGVVDCALNAGAVVIVQDEYLGVTATGGERESACLIGIDLSLHLCGPYCSKAMIGDGILRLCLLLVGGGVDNGIHGYEGIGAFVDAVDRPGKSGTKLQATVAKSVERMQGMFPRN
jgi:hypothetical protein